MPKAKKSVSLEEVMDWIFGEDERDNGLKTLKKMLDRKVDPLQHVRDHFPGRKLKKEVETHMVHVMDTDVEKRNAMIHSGKVLKFIYDLKMEGTDVPPPWVCKT